MENNADRAIHRVDTDDPRVNAFGEPADCPETRYSLEHGRTTVRLLTDEELKEHQSEQFFSNPEDSSLQSDD